MMPDKPLAYVPPSSMANQRYAVQVMPYAFGQYRLQLLDTARPDCLWPDLPSIVREACTYHAVTMAGRVAELIASADPEATMERWAAPYNCEGKGERIRLDNTPENGLTPP